MKNKYISKITMLTALFIAGVVNAQNFYTCMPEKSWVLDVIKEEQERIKKEEEERRRQEEERRRKEEEERKRRELEAKLASAIGQINNSNVWILLFDNNISENLDFGVYKVILASASGGNGGKADSNNKYGKGGAGEIKTSVFSINQKTKYYSCIGSRGDDAKDGLYSGGGGGGGAGSAFKLENGKELIILSGGGGGGGASEGSNAGGGGGGGAGYGCGAGGNGGEGYYGGGKGIGGKIKDLTYSNLFTNTTGNDGKYYNSEKEGYGGWGGSGGIICAKGGKGGSLGGSGDSGFSCQSGQGNFGDGYVRIYKYIG